MTTIEVERFGFGRDSTLAAVSLSDDPFTCFTLEDERRKVKVPGETCIPVGQYEVLLRTDSAKFEARYRARFPDMHRGMLWLQDVPGFKYIYLHMGNDDDDTDGCLLPGITPVVLPSGEFTVVNSRDAYIAIYKRALAAMDSGERVLVVISERGAA